MQSKRVDEPYSKGDGDVQYNVVYVARMVLFSTMGKL